MKTVFIPVWMLAVAWTTLACGWFEGRQSDDSVVGIHLGSSYASVGIYQNGKVHIIPDDEGSGLMPTFVAFTPDGEHLIGRAAKDYLLTNPENTVFDVKRLIGRRWNDTVVQKNIKKYPFRVINKNDKPHIVVAVGNEENKIMTSEEISAMILGKLKETAEAYLVKEVKSAVIAVPAYFNDAQRQATIKAAAMVGINVLRIYNEPAAAAVAYGLHQVEGETNILVFSLGGRTCDVTVMDSDTGVLDILSVDGDMDLGGETFDERVVEHFIKLYKKRNGKDIRGDNRAVQKLRREVEKTKRGLSSQHQSRVEVESMFEGEDFSETLTRAKFEELNMDLFQSAVGLIPRALAQADLTREDINEVLLVGGSTSIPKIQQLLTDFFGGKELSRSIDPQEVVTYGAAVFGGKVENDIILCDFTPLSYGIETAGGLMATIIPRNTMGMVRKSEIFSTASENQSAVMVKVYQGERTMVRDNQYLGMLNLTGIQPAPRGGPQIEVTFEIDANMVLKVSAEDKGSGNYNEILIGNEIMALTPEEIEHMLVEAEEFAEKDKIAKEVAEGRINEDSFPFSLLRRSANMEGQAQQQETRKREENSNNKEEL